MEVMNYSIKISPAAEGGYWAEAPALPGCFGHADTLEEVTALMRDAIETVIRTRVTRGEALPVEKHSKRRTFRIPVSVRVNGGW